LAAALDPITMLLCRPLRSPFFFKTSVQLVFKAGLKGKNTLHTAAIIRGYPEVRVLFIHSSLAARELPLI
jgi:hypothetical protein